MLGGGHGASVASTNLDSQTVRGRSGAFLSGPAQTRSIDRSAQPSADPLREHGKLGPGQAGRTDAGGATQPAADSFRQYGFGPDQDRSIDRSPQPSADPLRKHGNSGPGQAGCTGAGEATQPAADAVRRSARDAGQTCRASGPRRSGMPSWRSTPCSSKGGTAALLVRTGRGPAHGTGGNHSRLPG